MNQRTKVRWAVSAGTVAIEAALLTALWFAASAVLQIFDSLTLSAITDGRGTGEGIRLVSLLATLPLLVGAYLRASEFLTSRLCWALVRRFHAKG
ncbi:hypothetical protein [Rhizobium rhizogenes]|uniref:hypothetical protein n=1 Tax=Rhizobium rhizogenes TaxID=359 RepID=UPI0012950516|nr:hypothetical protein [Rhizobium rhizogenes]MQB34735.1 hypothetical protein [Rhizobium rhizogenes]